MEQETVLSNQYSKNNKLWFTSDRLVFFEEQKARNHARNLADKTITSKTKERVEAELEALINDTSEEDNSCYPIYDEEL
jgi:hypothetical protein